MVTAMGRARLALVELRLTASPYCGIGIPHRSMMQHHFTAQLVRVGAEGF